MKKGYSITMNPDNSALIIIDYRLMDEYTVKKICEDHDLLTSGLSKIKIKVVGDKNSTTMFTKTPEEIANLKV